jgi:hypothetical protein
MFDDAASLTTDLFTEIDTGTYHEIELPSNSMSTSTEVKTNASCAQYWTIVFVCLSCIAITNHKYATWQTQASTWWLHLSFGSSEWSWHWTMAMFEEKLSRSNTSTSCTVEFIDNETDECDHCFVAFACSRADHLSNIDKCRSKSFQCAWQRLWIIERCGHMFAKVEYDEKETKRIMRMTSTVIENCIVVCEFLDLSSTKRQAFVHRRKQVNAMNERKKERNNGSCWHVRNTLLSIHREDFDENIDNYLIEIIIVVIVRLGIHTRKNILIIDRT